MPIGELPGTLASPKLGTFGATKVWNGSLAGARFYQAMGTHLNGSIAGLTTLQRYAVWPVPFPNATYQGVITPLVRANADLANLKVAALTKTAGSLKYAVRNNGAVSNGPYGSLFIVGFGP